MKINKNENNLLTAYNIYVGATAHSRASTVPVTSSVPSRPSKTKIFILIFIHNTDKVKQKSQ